MRNTTFTDFTDFHVRHRIAKVVFRNLDRRFQDHKFEMRISREW